MAYAKHNFQSGEVLYAQQLNEMEEQIADVERALQNQLDGVSEEVEQSQKAISEQQQNLENYVPKEAGKGLSSNDFTDADKRQIDFFKGSDRNTNNPLIVDIVGAYSDGNRHNFIATDDASTLVDSPVTRGAFYAYREVASVPMGNERNCVIVTLREAYPKNGRIWTNTYYPSSGTWLGWKENALLNDVINGVDRTAEQKLSAQAKMGIVPLNSQADYDSIAIHDSATFYFIKEE